MTLRRVPLPCGLLGHLSDQQNTAEKDTPSGPNQKDDGVAIRGLGLGRCCSLVVPTLRTALRSTQNWRQSKEDKDKAW